MWGRSLPKQNSNRHIKAETPPLVELIEETARHPVDISLIRIPTDLPTYLRSPPPNELLLPKIHRNREPVADAKLQNPKCEESPGIECDFNE